MAFVWLVLESAIIIGGIGFILSCGFLIWHYTMFGDL